MYKIVEHPLIKIKLSRMRNKHTDSRDFRSNLLELSQFMSFEVTKDLKLTTFEIETPLAKTNGYKLETPVVLVPILRAGLGMVDGFKLMCPQASIGHIGLYRDEKTLNPVQYYCKMPKKIAGADVIVLDPMLATGLSTIKAIDIIKTYKPKSIRVACVISAPEGLKALKEYDDSIQVFTCAVDEKLDENSYIIPGLGDAGDRIFGTK
jgi:uracil phosphoribosyltransferase